MTITVPVKLYTPAETAEILGISLKGITATLTPVKKPKLKVTDLKRMVKGMEKIGKTVTGAEARRDGSIAVSVADPASAVKPSYWDKVLPK